LSRTERVTKGQHWATSESAAAKAGKQTEREEGRVELDARAHAREKERERKRERERERERERGRKNEKKEYAHALKRWWSAGKTWRGKPEKRRAEKGSLMEDEEYNKRTCNQMYKRINYNP